MELTFHQSNPQQRCILCGRSADNFARSHIIPKSFFNRLPEMAGVSLQNRFAGRVLSSAGESRNYTNAFYINHEICQNCEHEILEKCDTRAAEVYLRQIGADVVIRELCGTKLIVMPLKIDRMMLRAFWASLLWRFSVAKTFLFEDFHLPGEWEFRIREDLKSNASFDYIDAMCTSLTDPAMANFDSPRIIQMNDGFSVNIRMPMFHATVYVGCDGVCASNGVLDVGGIKCGSSLREDFPGLGYLFAETKSLPGEFEKLQSEFNHAVKSGANKVHRGGNHMTQNKG